VPGKRQGTPRRHQGAADLRGPVCSRDRRADQRLGRRSRPRST